MPIILPGMFNFFPGEMTNLITNLVREKKMGVTHEKMGNWPQELNSHEVLRVKYPFFWPKMLIHFPGEMANSITLPVREKKLGVTHEKLGIWPPKPYFCEVLGSNAHYFAKNVDFFFAGEMTNLITNLVREKKVGVTHEKMAICPQKCQNKALLTPFGFP